MVHDDFEDSYGDWVPNISDDQYVGVQKYTNIELCIADMIFYTSYHIIALKTLALYCFVKSC